MVETSLVRGLPHFRKTLCFGKLALRHSGGHVVAGLFCLLATLCGSKRELHQSEDVIAPHAFAAFVAYAEAFLSPGETLFCGFSEPLGCLRKIGSLPSSFRINEAEVRFRQRLFLIGGFAEPFLRFGIVLRNAVTRNV